MDPILTLFLFCGWHLLVLGAGVAIGLLRPWQWRIVRPEPPDHPGPARRAADEYHEQDEVFARVRS